MLYSSLDEIKAVLEIPVSDTSEDLKLNFFNEWATSIIEEAINRPGLSKASRTEFYSGTNTKQLQLKSRPIFTTPAIQVFVDQNGYFGSRSGSFDSGTELTFGTDYCLQLDQPDGTSRCGILLRLNGAWVKDIYRQRGWLSPYVGPSYGSIKVVYTGGYTVDSLPASFRAAADLLIARLRHLMPLGIELSHESYEERVVGYINQHKSYLLGLIRPILLPFRNWTF